MKIAFFVPSFPSLSQTFVLNQITGLLERGHEVDIFAQRPGNEVKVHADVIHYELLNHTHFFLKIPYNKILRSIKGASLIGKYLPRHPSAVLNALNFYKHGKFSASFYLLYQSIPFFKNNTFDIIHCHFGRNGNIAMALREAGVISGKIVTVFHGYDLTSFLAKTDLNVYQKLFKKGDLFLPISNRWEKKLIQLGCDRSKINVHRMGIDLDKINSQVRSSIKDRCVKILSVARLEEKKGMEFGIRAISEVIKNYPNIQYNIIGDGPLRNDLQNLIDRLQLDKTIKLMGWMNQKETFEFMRQSDIFLAPSITSLTGDQEGIPVVLMEAMAHKLPVVSTYHSGIPELVLDAKTGFLVEEKDWQGLAQKIELLISNPDMIKKFGNEGRRTVEADYNIRTLNDNLVKTFQSLIDSSQPNTFSNPA